MRRDFGRIVRALLLTGGIATAIALPSLVGTPLMPSNLAQIALAAPAFDNDNHGDRTNDNSDERKIEGQVVELRTDISPPQARVGMVGGDVWARLYRNQLHDSGLAVGDYVKMQGEYSDHGIFDAYHVDVVERWGDNGNGNGNHNGNDNH